MVALRLYFGDIIHTHSYPPPMWDGRRSTAVDPYIAPDSDSESDTGEYLLATYLVLLSGTCFPVKSVKIWGGGSNRYMHLGTEPSPSGWETKLFSTMRSQVGSTSLSTNRKTVQPYHATRLNLQESPTSPLHT